MYYVIWEDHYEPGQCEKEFDSREDALNFMWRVQDDGGWAMCLDENGDSID